MLRDFSELSLKSQREIPKARDSESDDLALGRRPWCVVMCCRVFFEEQVN